MILLLIDQKLTSESNFLRCFKITPAIMHIIKTYILYLNYPKSTCMIKMQVILTAICFFSIRLQAQSDIETVKENETDFYVSQESLSKIIQNKFGQLALGEKDASVLSNYVAVDAQNGSVSFNTFLAFSKKIYLTTNISTGINDNISVLFKGFKLNNNSSLDIRAHFRIGQMTRFLYSYKDKLELKEKLHGVDIESNYKQENVVNLRIFNASRIEVDSFQLHVLNKRVQKLEDELKNEIGSISYNAEVDDNTSSEKAEKCRKLYDEILKIKHEYAGVKMRLDSLQYNTNLLLDTIKLKESIAREALEKKKIIEVSAPWVGMHFFWITARINPIRKSFYQFHPGIAFEKQLTKEKSNFLRVGVEFSYYQWKKKVKSRTLYLNAGISYMEDNNLDDLSLIEYKDETTDVSGNTTRKTNSSYKAYKGEYKEFGVINTYVNFYQFFSNSNQTALHIFPDIDFREENVTLYNLGVGLVLSVKDKKNEKAIINAEPFFRLTDMADNIASGLSFFKRSEIGLRIGLPINPLINQ